MTRQCIGCGTVLPVERRSPHCERCRVDFQHQRNREKVWAYRNRAREARTGGPAVQVTRLPNEEELAWLEWLNLGLAEPIRRIAELVAAGRGTTDPEVMQLAREALEQYDTLRSDFEERVRLRPDPTDQAGNWRGFFESVRRALG